MIVNPYAEQPQLADEIRKWDKTFTYDTALVAAAAAIESMIAGTSTAPVGRPPGWRPYLINWIIQDFLVPPGVAEAAYIAITGPAPAPGGQQITQTGYYSKTNLWPGDDGRKFTFAAFLNGPTVFENVTDNSGGIMEDLSIITHFTNWDDVNNQIGLQIRISGTLRYFGTSLGKVAHGINKGDWFALMCSVDWSADGVPAVVKMWTHKKDDVAAVDITPPAPSPDTNGWSALSIDFDHPGGDTYVGGDVLYFRWASFGVAEWFFDGPDTAIDFSLLSERDKYVDATGRPVGLGPTGSLLTGAQPKYYCPDGLDTNLGTAGDYTVVGTISPTPTSPSD